MHQDKTKVILLLQGGGALGAFQAGAWTTLAPLLRDGEHELVAVAGASIGAVNAGLIASRFHDEDGGAAALEAFWRETLARPPAPLLPLPGPYGAAWNGLLTSLCFGNPALFAPQYRNWQPLAAAQRFRLPPYSTAPALDTLRSAFGRYRGNAPLLLVGATDVDTGRGRLFDSAGDRITAEMLQASLGIPLLFTPAEVDGRPHWDYDMRANTLLPEVFERVRALRPDAAGGRWLVVALEMFDAGGGGLPTTEMESSYRLMNLMLGGRMPYDAREFETANAHLAALERLRDVAAAGADTPFAAAVEDEYRQALAARLGRVELLRINRLPLEHEHIARDMDYSPARIAALIAQGRACAAAGSGRRRGVPERVAHAGACPGSGCARRAALIAPRPVTQASPSNRGSAPWTIPSYASITTPKTPKPRAPPCSKPGSRATPSN